MRASKLFEREDELSQIDSALALAREARGSVLTVEGPAGIGKTAILSHARKAASQAEMKVLAARGSALERELPFAAARQLFEPTVSESSPAERNRLLEGAAALARPIAMPETSADIAPAADPARQPQPDPAAVQHGLYWLCANLAAAAPLLVAVDDAHWVDEATLHWLAYLSTRLEGLPILLLIARRTGEPGDERHEMAAAHATAAARQILRPRPLSASASTSLIRSILGESAAQEFCTACHEASGGNPHWLIELLRACREEGIEPLAEGADRLRRLAPPTVSRAVSLRLAGMPEGAVPLTRALAVLEEAPLSRIAALAELPEAEAQAAADALAAAHLICGPGRFTFSHPVVREAVLGDTPPATRSAFHLQAARLLANEGRPPEEIAAHLIVSEPADEPWAADALRAAGRSAGSRGAPEQAVTFFRRALAELPPGPDRGALLIELGSTEARLGRPEAADHLRQARQEAADESKLAAANLESLRGLSLLGRWEEVIDEASGLDLASLERAGEREVIAEVAAMTRIVPEVRERSLEALGQLAATDYPDLAARIAMASLAHEAVVAAESVERVIELARAAQSDGGLAGLCPESPARLSLFLALIGCGRHEEAGRVLQRSLDDATERGFSASFSFGCVMGSYMRRRFGSLVEAEADLATARGAIDGEPGVAHPVYWAELILLCLERGDLETASAGLESSGFAEAPLGGWMINMLIDSRARLRIARGELESGVEDLLALGGWWRELGASSPAHSDWRSTAAFALMRLERDDEARELAREELEWARAAGAPREVGVALRALALVEPGDESVEMLREAARLLDEAGAPLDAARAHTDLGAALRRAGYRREAREPLRHGLDLAARNGASVLADRAEQELRASGARPRRTAKSGLESLTPSERRICSMAAEGMTNREIAQSLFVTLNTVETHLTHAYAKLEITSRSEIPAELHR